MNTTTALKYSPDTLQEFRERLLYYISSFETSILLDSNTAENAPVPVTGIHYDLIGGAGVVDEVGSDTHSLEELQQFIDTHRAKQNFVFGYFSYDLKNEFEKLSSSHPDYTQFPSWHFFVPDILFTAKNGQFEIRSSNQSTEEILKLIDESKPLVNSGNAGKIIYKPELGHYLKMISAILKNIYRGNIYEMNYCDEVRIENCTLNPANVFKNLIAISPNPFSAYYRHRQHAVACASPERFIMKRDNRIYSQPMKGTMPRSNDKVQDETYKHMLINSPKERSENVMITDLVRNDLSRIGMKGTVRVDDLFGVYAFKKSHQMITTVSCEVKNDIRFTDIIRALFPMGSMTGAPKISAMQLIEKYETFRRGLFSGTIGYLSPDGDFDFNVVIRSIFFNTKLQRASIAAGGAITFSSDPVKEYDEMLLKLRPQMKVMGD